MRYLYYCNSTYQLINTINLHYQRKYLGFENINDYKGDLIFLNSFKGANEVFKRIKEAGIFDSIKIIDRAKNSGIFHSFKTLKDVIFPASFLKKAYGFDKEDIKNKYDVIMVPKVSRISLAIYQLNPSAKIDIQEDGLANYNDGLDLSPGSSSKIYKYFYKLFNNGKDFSKFNHYYLNNLALYDGKYLDRVKENPKYTNETIELTKKLLLGKDLKQQEKKIYWLMQYGYDEVDEITNELLKQYQDDVLCCRHPRYPINKYDSFEFSPLDQIWELKILSLSDLDDSVLVTVNSTACFSPKILFNKEPYLILTYKLLNSNDFEGRFVDFLDKFINTYKNKDKILIPNDQEEFIDMLKTLLQKDIR